AAHALVVELLHALAFERLAGVEVALRIDRETMWRVELARDAAAVAEAGDRLEVHPIQHPDLLIHPVSDVEISLPRIARKRDVPDRAGAERCRREGLFFHERPVGL